MHGRPPSEEGEAARAEGAHLVRVPCSPSLGRALSLCAFSSCALSSYALSSCAPDSRVPVSCAPAHSLWVYKIHTSAFSLPCSFFPPFSSSLRLPHLNLPIRVAGFVFVCSRTSLPANDVFTCLPIASIYLHVLPRRLSRLKPCPTTNQDADQAAAMIDQGDACLKRPLVDFSGVSAWPSAAPSLPSDGQSFSATRCATDGIGTLTRDRHRIDPSPSLPRPDQQGYLSGRPKTRRKTCSRSLRTSSPFCAIW